MQRGRGAEGQRGRGERTCTNLSPAPLLPCSPAPLHKVLRDVVRNPGLIPSVTMMGAILALFADLFSQLAVSQMVLPLNAVTALIGTPVVTWVILRRNSQKSFPS